MKLTQKSKGFILLSSNLCAVGQTAGSHRDDILGNQVKLVAFFCSKNSRKGGRKIKHKEKEKVSRPFEKKNRMACIPRASFAGFWATVSAAAMRLTVLAEEEMYDILCVGKEETALAQSILKRIYLPDCKHLVIVEDMSQTVTLPIREVFAFCRVREEGKVTFYEEYEDRAAD